MSRKSTGLAHDPSGVLGTIVAASTALNVRLATRKLGRDITADDFERMTLSSAPQRRAADAADYAEAELKGFEIARSLAEFFQGCDVFLSPTLCLPPVKLGELILWPRICPISRAAAALYAGHQHVQRLRPTRDVGAAGMECGRPAAWHECSPRALVTRRR